MEKIYKAAISSDNQIKKIIAYALMRKERLNN